MRKIVFARGLSTRLYALIIETSKKIMLAYENHLIYLWKEIRRYNGCFINNKQYKISKMVSKINFCKYLMNDEECKGLN